MSSVRQSFRPRPIPGNGLAGAFFWALSRAQQIARVRELTKRGLSAAQISSITRESVATVRALAEAQL